MLGGRLEGCHHLALQGDVDRDALALVAVLGLDSHWHAHFQCRSPGVVHVTDGAAHGHRHTGGAQQFFGQVLVLRNRLGHRAGGVQLGGLDAPLAGSPAKLHQAALGQAAVRNTARHGGVHNRAGAGPHALVLVQLAQLRQGVVHVKAAVVQGGMHQRLRQRHGQLAHGLFAVFDHHLVGAGLQCHGGVAEGHRATGSRLQSQCGQCQHMRQRHRDHLSALGGLPQCTQAGEQGTQLHFKAGQAAQAASVGLAGHDGFQRRVAAPEVGAAQGPDAGNFHYMWHAVIHSAIHS